MRKILITLIASAVLTVGTGGVAHASFTVTPGGTGGFEIGDGGFCWC